jgi:SM-20-related protein
MTLQADFLTRLGIFVAPDFLDRETCEGVRDEMVRSGGDPATVTVRLTDDRLAERYRRTTIAEVSPESVSLIENRLLGVKERLEESFSLALEDCEKPQFLLYRKGDFIRPHSDGAKEEEAPDWLRKRTVSCVVFLNDQSEEEVPGTFGGGALTFYELLSQDPRGRSVGLPVAPKAGLLVAFTADVVHGVTEVTRGERCTVVTWFGRLIDPPPAPKLGRR